MGSSESRPPVAARRLGAASWKILAACACVALVPLVLSERVALAVGQILEERFPSQPALPAELHGIIILGGDLEYDSTGMKSARIATAIPLAARFGNARIVLSGAYREAADGRSMLIGAGVSASRIVTETHAKTTWENATFTRVLIGSELTWPWVLITSALHMPRAIGAFRQAGFNVIGVPADRKTPERLARISLREAFALISYRMMSRSSAFLPAPDG
jgi:uncharacterized SAM-binding protein YcdF (DUF218 family)